jgi:tetratricopeptide (TPR) repeat protein
MTRIARIRILVALLAVLLPCPALAQFQPWEGSSVLDDPEWRARFLGSYGFLSGAEPQIRADELALLREVVDLMKVNPRAAATMLEVKVGQDSSAALDFVLGNLDFQNGDLDGAALSYASAIEKFPDFRRAHKNLGLLRLQRGQFHTAAQHLGRAIELGDRDGRSFGLLGYAYINQENWIAAEQAYRQAILQQPDTRDWKLGLAQALLALEKYADAVALFGSLIDEDPKDVTAWKLQANAYIGLDRPRDAAVNLETIRMLGKADSASLVLLGDIYMNAGMPELAADAYLTVIANDKEGTRFAAAYRAARLLIQTGSFADARKVLDRIEARYAPKLGADDELKVLTLEARLARAEGREAEAARLLRSIVERDGTRGEALLELAAYHRSRGEDEQALLLIERAQRLDAWEYRALLDEAQLRVGQRDYAKAAETLRKALRIKSEPRVERFLARVEQAIRL